MSVIPGNGFQRVLPVVGELRGTRCRHRLPVGLRQLALVEPEPPADPHSRHRLLVVGRFRTLPAYPELPRGRPSLRLFSNSLTRAPSASAPLSVIRIRLSRLPGWGDRTVESNATP